MKINKYFQVYKKFIYTSLASELEYKTNIIIDLFTAILSLLGSIFRKTRKKIKVSKKGCLSLHCLENFLFFQNLVGNKCAKYISSKDI